MADATCSIDGCEKRRHGRGWCSMHYARWRKHGNPLIGARPMSSREEYFWARVNRGGPTECWTWSGALQSYGYGDIHHREGRISAHRFSYELHHGAIAAGGVVCHRCDNPPCVNPAHLFVGTQADNMADKVSKGRQAKGERVATAKLTDAQFHEMLELKAAGIRQVDIASRFGVTQQAVSQYLKRCRRAGLVTS